MGQVHLAQAQRHTQHHRQHHTAQVKEGKPCGAPLSLQHGGNPVVEIAGQQQHKRAGCVGHHHPGHQTPHLTIQNQSGHKLQITHKVLGEHHIGEHIHQVHGNLAEDDDFHQIGNAKIGMLGTEPINGPIATISIDQRKSSSPQGIFLRAPLRPMHLSILTDQMKITSTICKCFPVDVRQVH